jgi:hypothetical protein
MILKARAVLWLGRSFLVVLLIPVVLYARQEAIRVESNQVLVPTVVFDKVLYAQLNKMAPHHGDSYGHIVVKNTKLWEQITPKNLTTKDFHLFEDGQEQRIQSVRFEPPAFRVVDDNLGKHPETVGIGGGIWGYPDHPAGEQSMWLPLPKYVIAYVPAPSAVGSCHGIQVKVNQEKLTVWARSEYCNTPHPAADPLEGTELGKKLETAMRGTKENSLDVKLTTAVFPENAEMARVYVSLEFPPESLTHMIRNGRLYATIGSLVMVYRKDGTVAARYSDFACCDYGSDRHKEKDATADLNATSGGEAQAQTLIPSRYHTEFALAAGDYEVRAALSDGIHFGAQTAALSIKTNEPDMLGISDVVLSRRVRKVSPTNSGVEEQFSESYTPLVSKGVEYTPTGNLRFWPGDTLFVYFEIRDPLVKGQTVRDVQANFRIADVGTGAVVDAFEPVNVASYAQADSLVVAVGRGVPLKNLTPGEYRLEVRAREGAGTSTEWRSSIFTVTAAAPLQTSATMPSEISTASANTGKANPTPQPAVADQPKKEEVLLNISAVDTNDRPVTDLTRVDFQVFEDDKPQTITSFRATPAPDAP